MNLTVANLTQWASYVQDVASGMWRPPHAAMECPTQDIAGVLHRLENLTRVGFCHLCHTLGNSCGCAGATYQAPHSYGSMALWVPPQPSYASMASSTMTRLSTRLSHNWSACTDGRATGLQPTGPCWGRKGTSASFCARLSQATGAWPCGLVPAMPFGSSSTGCCLRRSGGTSSHAIPAGGASTSAGKVCPSCHQS